MIRVKGSNMTLARSFIKRCAFFLTLHVVAHVSSFSTNNPNFNSRSTASPDQSSPFFEGIAERKERLHSALEHIGIDPLTLADLETAGTAALRAYNSFVLPKSEGALAVTQTPTRASVVANNISFYMREHQSHQQEWLVNHDRVLASTQNRPRQPLTIVLDNIRSAANVGNILRSAETARVEKVVLCGITPGPPNKQVLKTAVGAAEYVPFERAPSTLETIRALKEAGVQVLGVETTERSSPLWKTIMPRSLALVFGNEIVGVHTDVLEECDGIVCIPTHGVKNSLNVATCASIVIWEALRQWEDGS